MEEEELLLDEPEDWEVPKENVHEDGEVKEEETHVVEERDTTVAQVREEVENMREEFMDWVKELERKPKKEEIDDVMELLRNRGRDSKNHGA